MPMFNQSHARGMSRSLGFSRSLSKVNAGKISSSAFKVAESSVAALKKIDTSSLVKGAKKASSGTTVFKKLDVSKATKKSSKEMTSSINEFASHPGARGKLSQVASAMKRNPKIAAAGITTTAAAGYVAFRMGEGATFAEAIDELVDAATDVAEKAVDAATDVAVGSSDKLLTAMFGENYKMYLYAAGLVWVLIMVFKIKNLLF